MAEDQEFEQGPAVSQGAACIVGSDDPNTKAVERELQTQAALL
jgi:hypothetical protein